MRTKKEIVTELVENGHVTFDEALTLLETEKEYIYVPNIQYHSYPLQPYYTTNPYTITSSSDLGSK